MAENTDLSIDDVISGVITEMSETEPDVPTVEDDTEPETVEDATDEETSGEEDALQELAADQVADDAEAQEDAEAEEADETVDEDPEDEQADEAFELGPEDVVVIDGKEIKVSDAMLRQADYTRKTTELAEQRKAFEAEQELFRESQSYLEGLETAWQSDPSSVISGFAGAVDDPIDLINESAVQMAEAGDLDPNVFVIQNIVSLIKADLLDGELRELLGFDSATVEKLQAEAQTEKRLKRIERSIQQPKQQAPGNDEAAVEAARARLTQEWEQIVNDNSSLSELSEDQLIKVRSEVAKVAMERKVPLDVAWDLMQAQTVKAEREAEKAKAKVVRKKSKAAKVVSKPSNAPSSATAPKKLDVESAIAEAMDELRGRS